MGKYIRYNTPEYFCVDCKVQKGPDDFYPKYRRKCKKCIIRRSKRRYNTEKGKVVVQGKMLRLFQVAIFMAGQKRMINEIAARFDMTQRTAYRYIRLIDELDLGLEQDFNGRYFLVIDPCPLCGRKHENTTNDHYELLQA